jgi:ABC-type multidrug transport system ATPase subunit
VAGGHGPREDELALKFPHISLRRYNRATSQCRKTLPPSTLCSPATPALFTGKVAILDNISLSIGPGTPTVLVGPNGAGRLD